MVKERPARHKEGRKVFKARIPDSSYFGDIEEEVMYEGFLNTYNVHVAKETTACHNREENMSKVYNIIYTILYYKII